VVDLYYIPYNKAGKEAVSYQELLNSTITKPPGITKNQMASGAKHLFDWEYYEEFFA
jgi:hypothetical protein